MAERFRRWRLRRSLSVALDLAYRELGRQRLRTPGMERWLQVVEHTADASDALAIATHWKLPLHNEGENA